MPRLAPPDSGFARSGSLIMSATWIDYSGAQGHRGTAWWDVCRVTLVVTRKVHSLLDLRVVKLLSEARTADGSPL
jgi:hypothetical protein